MASNASSSRTVLFRDMGFTEDDDAVYLRHHTPPGVKRVRLALSPWAMFSVADEGKELPFFCIWLQALGVNVEELDVAGFKAEVRDGAVHATLPKAKKKAQSAATASMVEKKDQSSVSHAHRKVADPMTPTASMASNASSSRSGLFRDMGCTEDDDGVYIPHDMPAGVKRVRVALSPWAMLSVAEESQELPWACIWLPALGLKVEELNVAGMNAVVQDGVVLVTLPKKKKKKAQLATTTPKVAEEDQSSVSEANKQ